MLPSGSEFRWALFQVSQSKEKDPLPWSERKSGEGGIPSGSLRPEVFFTVSKMFAENGFNCAKSGGTKKVQLLLCSICLKKNVMLGVTELL